MLIFIQSLNTFMRDGNISVDHVNLSVFEPMSDQCDGTWLCMWDAYRLNTATELGLMLCSNKGKRPHEVTCRMFAKGAGAHGAYVHASLAHS